MATSSSSPIPPPQREYDVFLSFSGLDSRKTIISHLRVALEQNGFRTFRDDKNLDRGKSIAPRLLEAIENSSMSLVVFSKNYFASTWCLGELEKIMECSKNLQHIVLPIFYDMKSSDVRKLKGCIVESLAKHEEEVPNMENWRTTLTEVASLAGFVSNNYRDEASLVEDIVEEVQGKLNSGIHLNVATHPVGIVLRLQNLLKLLCLESSDDVRIIAIWGVGGLGKTTIAKAVYNRIHSRFEGCSFVANVRETWEQSRGDLLALQKQILFDISKNENYKIGNSHAAVEFIKRRAFYGRKVLLVLDDVDPVEQLNALAINPRFLHRGSRIIVTTRNISSLNSLQSVLSKYEPEELNKDESLLLFNLHAFNEHNPPKGFMELSNIVVDYAGGIPLVLEVLGSFLNGKNHQSEWRSAITKLKKIPHNDVQRKLRISFDSLDTEEKKLFLDIACFFVGKSKNFTIQVLQDCDIFPEIGFRRLEDLCLLKYDLEPEPKFLLLFSTGFKVLSKLKFLDLSSCHNLTTTPNFSGLKNLEKLFLINCVRLQEVDKSIGHLHKLLVLDLSNCESLRKLPLEIANLKSLERFIISQSLSQCQTLTKKSTGSLGLSINLGQSLRCLKVLHIGGCSMTQVPDEIGSMISLTNLSICRSKFGCLPESICNLTKLETLHILYCRMPNLPSELGRLNRLEILHLVGNKFCSLPKSIGDLTNLQNLSLSHCPRLQSLPESISDLTNLQNLSLSHCPRLQ